MDADYRADFSRKDYNGAPMKDLTEIIKYVQPTALLGLSTTKGAFNQSVIETMSALNPRPIIFPLSNPVRLSECEFHEAVAWTDGKVLFASGSPFPEVQFGGRTLYPGQGESRAPFPVLLPRSTLRSRCWCVSLARAGPHYRQGESGPVAGSRDGQVPAGDAGVPEQGLSAGPLPLEGLPAELRNVEEVLEGRRLAPVGGRGRRGTHDGLDLRVIRGPGESVGRLPHGWVIRVLAS